MAARAVIASDHGGFTLKEKLKKVLEQIPVEVTDVGTDSSRSCDYPEFGFKAARMVSRGEVDIGIAICRSGIGMSMVTNKLPGVRAGLCMTVRDARSAREHNAANMLVLAADRLSLAQAERILRAWLAARPAKGRHARRVGLISEYEDVLYKKVFVRTERKRKGQRKNGTPGKK